MKTRLKINGFIIFIVVLLIALFPSTFFRKEIADALDETAEILGFALILFGQVVRISARGYKSEHSQQGQVLIQGGPYAFVRNPMYLGILLIGSGIVLIFFQWWVAVAFLSIFIARYLLLIFKEEKKLLVLFPKDYKQYQQTVPRIFPSLKALFYQDISEYFPLKWPWLKKEIGTVATVLFVVFLVESCKDIRAQGIKVFLKEGEPMLLIILLFIFLAIYLHKKTENVG